MKKSLKPLLCVLVLVMSVSLIMVFSSGGCRPAVQLVEKITFLSERDGNSEIYIMNMDGSGQTRLTNNLGMD